MKNLNLNVILTSVANILTSEGFWELEADTRSCLWLVKACFIISACKKFKVQNIRHARKDSVNQKACQLDGWSVSTALHTCFWTSPPIFWLRVMYSATGPDIRASKASTYADTAADRIISVLKDIRLWKSTARTMFFKFTADGTV